VIKAIKSDIPQFIQVDEKVLERKFKDKVLVWMPIALFRISGCRKDYFMTDCFIAPTIKSSLARLLLTRKVNQKIEFLINPPMVKAKIYEHVACDANAFITDLKNLYNSITSKGEEEGGWSQYVEPSRLALAHVISPVKWILGPMENLKGALSRSIFRSMIEEMLHSLCIDKDDVSVKDWMKAYTLIAIDEENERVYLVMGKKVIESEVYARFILRRPEIRNLIID